MVDEILKFTKLTFLIHFIVALIMAILYLIPGAAVSMFGIANTGILTLMGSTIGALFLGLSIGSLFGYLAKEWKEVKILVITELAWLITGVIIMIINAALVPAATAMILVIGFLLIALFLLSFLQQEEKIKELLK